jgi:hypothetical protein
MLLTEVENHRTDLLVILAGYKDKMEVLIGADPGLKRRFGTQLHLEDYSGVELAQMAETYALREFNLTFSPGLSEQLGEHIKQKHGEKLPVVNLVDGVEQTVMVSDIEQQNGGLAINLTERAVGQLQVRSVLTGKSGTSSRVLQPGDFGIKHAHRAHNAHIAPSGVARDILRRALQGDLEEGAELTGGGGGGVSVGTKEFTGHAAPPAARAAPAPPAPPTSVGAGGGRFDDDPLRAAMDQLVEALVVKVGERLGQPGLGALPAQRKGRDKPRSASGRRTARAAPTGGGTKTKTLLKSKARGKVNEWEEEEEEGEEEEEEEEAEQVLSQAQVVAALSDLGQCEAGFNWNDRASIDSPCQQCGAAKVKGWQCSGGTHWMCRACVVKHAKRGR